MYRTLGFAALYLLATYAGRLTVMDATNLSLVWPAAGILAVWFVAQRHSRWRWADVLALTVITMTVNMATGSSARLAAIFVVANLAQALVFVRLFDRWLPGLWVASGPPLTRLAELWRFIATAGASTIVGAGLGSAGMWLVTGHYSWESALVWLARNTVSILLVGVAARRIGWLVTHRRPPGTPSVWSAMGGPRRVEHIALVATSITAYFLVFGLTHGGPLAFTLIPITVWAGLRMRTTVVILHALLVGTIAILFTLHGSGPFAEIASHPLRALVAQLFVGTVAVVGLALALGRDERDALLDRLRLHRDELASFAGVVAHDLLNPLATVEGWSEALAGELDQEGRESVGRIQRAAARMRNLINGLLAYTTAREASLSPTEVDLNEVVRDVATGRLDQAATTTGPMPRFVIDDLAVVDADPVLTRQLLENLIGNAIKYTAPGVVPRITVSSERTGDGFVRIAVDDNGIGIPAGQHEAIFQNFHRAHTGAGYAGTGLGLAICKRIVERHGGTIAATANDEGGSRMTFTLPA